MHDEWLLRLYAPATGQLYHLWLDPQTPPSACGITWLADPGTRRILSAQLPAASLQVPFGALLAAGIDTSLLKKKETEKESINADQSRL